MGKNNNVDEIRYKWLIRFIRIITILWVALLVHWMCKCSADNHTQLTDITVNGMTDYYLCINCEVIEDSTWAETIHWHDDTTCLYSLGMFVCDKDTLKCDTVRVKKLSKKLSELSDRIGPTMISVVNNIGIKRVCEKIKRVM